MHRLRRRFWAETVFGTLSALLCLLTVAWPDWIEIVLHADPDAGNGMVEWAVVFMCAAVAVACFLLARADWFRTRKHQEPELA
jgi:hypothetical protein